MDSTALTTTSVAKIDLLWWLTALSLASSSLAAPDSSKTGRHFVWRVTKGGAQPLFLVGSLHAMRGSDYPLPRVIEGALASAQRVLFETDPNAKDAPLLEQKLSAAGTYSGRVRLGEKVSPQTFAYLKRIAQVRLSEYERRKPWAIAFFMLGQGGLDSFNTRLSVDRYIYNRARGRAEIGGLETTDEFVRGLASLSDVESESFLLEAISYANRCPQLLSDTCDSWAAGDPARMYRLYSPRSRRRSSGYWHWLERRQTSWLPRIEAAMSSDKSTIVVVGALHCCGPNGLPALLQKRGCRVEQM